VLCNGQRVKNQKNRRYRFGTIADAIRPNYQIKDIVTNDSVNFNGWHNIDRHWDGKNLGREFTEDQVKALQAICLSKKEKCA
jgi:hypothetical protein